jgi:hypothetical protein
VAAEPVRVVDLSVSGAGIVALPSTPLRPGAVMCLRLDGGKGHVQIRHVGIEFEPGSDELYYGVTFLRIDEHLRSVVHSLVVGRNRTFHSSRTHEHPQAASG